MLLKKTSMPAKLPFWAQKVGVDDCSGQEILVFFFFPKKSMVSRRLQMTKKRESNSQILNLFLMFHFNTDVTFLVEVALCNENMQDTNLS